MEKLTYPSFGKTDSKCDFMALAKMQAETANAQPGDLKGCDCPECLNRGYIMQVRDNGRLVAVECGCMGIRRSLRNMERSGLGRTIGEKTLASFRAEAPWQKRMAQGAEHYAANPEGWLLMCGQSGSGKTHLCTAVCRELMLRGMEVMYLSWRDEIDGLKAFRDEDGARARRMQELKTAQVLYVDDLFKLSRGQEGRPTAADLALAFEILNYRCNNRLPTLISTELTPQELVQLDGALGSRMVEMAGEHMYSIRRDPGKNYRLRAVKEL